MVLSATRGVLGTVRSLQEVAAFVPPDARCAIFILSRKPQNYCQTCVDTDTQKLRTAERSIALLSASALSIFVGMFP